MRWSRNAGAVAAVRLELDGISRSHRLPCCLFNHLFVVTIGRVSDELLVGRGQQLGVLQGLLGEVKAGVGGVVLVVGEQGVGKSSLLRAGLGMRRGRGARCCGGWLMSLGSGFRCG